MYKQILISGGIFAGLSVIIGAFGAHALKNTLSNFETTHIFELATKYQFYHALGILIIGLLAERKPSKLFLYASRLMALGILIFSGSLFTLAVTNIKWLGAITPIGGTSFIIAWGLFIYGVSKLQGNNSE